MNVICDGGGEGDESAMSPCDNSRGDLAEIEKVGTLRDVDDGAGIEAGIIGRGERSGGDGEAFEDEEEAGSISGSGLLNRRADPVSS